MQSNIKIMVNLDTKQITHTFSPPDSAAYKKLVKEGFVQEGTVKTRNKEEELPSGIKVFWDPRHFKEIKKPIHHVAN